MKNIKKAIAHLRSAGDFKLNKLADCANKELYQLVLERDSWKREAELSAPDAESLMEQRGCTIHNVVWYTNTDSVCPVCAKAAELDDAHKIIENMQYIDYSPHPKEA